MQSVTPTGWSTRLNTSRAHVWACVLVPLFFGLLSLWLGADSNWDLLHAHLYNAYAWLHGRLALDLAPAGMQSYFNPLLDASYYWMSTRWPGPLTGFVMGVLHGLNFVLLLGIVRRALPDLPAEDRYRLPLLLALAGCLTANFLSVLGNSMGDDTTALFVLGALLIVLANWEQFAAGGQKGLVVVVAAGLVAGLGTGLKLTNAVYALALCVAFLTLPLGRVPRLRLAYLFGVGTLLGLAVTGGWWFVEMWATFHNPLYPQFSALFPNPLTRNVLVADASWQPKGFIKALLWPFLFSWDSHRVGQVHIRQFIWALLYVLFWWWAARALWSRFRGGKAGAGEARGLYLITVVAVGYFVWMKLFSIYRYLVPLELLAPLLVFILLQRLLPYGRARRVATWTLSIATLVVLLGGVSTWGHEPWSEDMYRVQAPELPQANSTTVLLSGHEAPLTWLAAFLPADLSFVGLSEGFPESADYGQRAHAMIAARGGPVYALAPAYHSWRADDVARAQVWAGRLGLTRGEGGCATLTWLATHLHLHASVQPAKAGGAAAGCSLEVLPEDQEDTAAANRASAEATARLLKPYGLVLDPQFCVVYTAHVGQGIDPYQWCAVVDENGTR
ncbi:MAG TPA: hypothetical protein VKT74_00565 [Gammaproteobacteria bacterium]|nr:hypothetical protein [Gammaproteobacteria bacterium]